MKNLKLNKKTQIKKQIKVPQNEDMNSIQQLIFEDVKNINKFNIIIEEFILSLQNGDLKILNQMFKIILEIFEYFLDKNKDKISKGLKLFLEDKLNMIINVLLDLITPDEDINESLMKTILKNALNILKYTNEEKVNSFFENIVIQFILSDDLVDTSNTVLIANCINDKRYLKITIDILYEKLIKESNLNEYTLYNIYNFFITISKEIPTEIRLNYQNILVTLINTSTLPKELLRNILINLNKTILDNLENPLIFSDYLINIYEKSTIEEFDIKVLSLSGLFILITKYKLDYNNYYNILYKTISQKYYDADKVKTVFDSEYRNRLFKILELSLKSSTVPILTVLSFTKKLARICLFTSSNNIAIILGIIQNIIKKHPRSVILLKRNKKRVLNKNEKIISESKFDWDKFAHKNENEVKENLNLMNDDFVQNNTDGDYSFFSKFEQFNDEELDPFKTNAQMSCLWELYSLKNHFSFKIRNLVNKFEKNFLQTKEFDLNSISDLKEEDLLYEINENAHFYVTQSTEEDFELLNNKIKLLI